MLEPRLSPCRSSPIALRTKRSAEERNLHFRSSVSSPQRRTRDSGISATARSTAWASWNPADPQSQGSSRKSGAGLQISRSSNTRFFRQYGRGTPASDAAFAAQGTSPPGRRRRWRQQPPVAVALPCELIPPQIRQWHETGAPSAALLPDQPSISGISDVRSAAGPRAQEHRVANKHGEPQRPSPRYQPICSASSTNCGCG